MQTAVTVGGRSQMDIQGRVAVVTGAASGIGRAVALDLAQRAATTIAMVDRTECVASAVEDANRCAGRDVGVAFQGDVTDAAFRRHVFDSVHSTGGPVSISVPAAAITRDALPARVRATCARWWPPMASAWRRRTPSSARSSTTTTH